MIIKFSEMPGKDSRESQTKNGDKSTDSSLDDVHDDQGEPIHHVFK